MIDLTSKLDLRALLAFPDKFIGQASTAVKTTALEIKADMIDQIEHGPKTGRVYERGERDVSFKTRAGKDVAFTARRGSKAKAHQASAPGEAPATDTGALVNSIAMEMVDRVTARDTVSAEYAQGLEFGTPHVAARPFLRPAAERARPKFMDRLKRVVSTAAKAAGGRP